MRESSTMSALRMRKVFGPVLLNDVGAGAVTALTIIATLVTVAGLVLPFAGFMVVQVRAQALSDRAALAAADAVAGALVGQPCALAADIVAAMRQIGRAHV